MRMMQSCMHLVEYANPARYQRRVGEWMKRHDVENCELLRILATLTGHPYDPGMPELRMFAVMDREQVVASAVLHGDGHLVITRASHEAQQTLADGLIRANCPLSSVSGPADAAWEFAGMWASRTGQYSYLDSAENADRLPAGSHKITFWAPARLGAI